MHRPRCPDHHLDDEAACKLMAEQRPVEVADPLADLLPVREYGTPPPLR